MLDTHQVTSIFGNYAIICHITFAGLAFCAAKIRKYLI